MAVAPLFVADLDTLKQRLRLTSIKTEAQYLVDEAIECVRAGFVRRLTQSRVTQLVAITYEENTTDETKMLRTIANRTEVDWIKAELLRSMPMFSVDAAGTGMGIWNDEPYSRMSVEEREVEYMRLMSRVKDNLDLLEDEEEFGDETSIESFNF